MNQSTKKKYEMTFGLKPASKEGETGKNAGKGVTAVNH